MGTNSHISITSTELATVHALPRIGLKVATLVRTKRAVDIGGEGSQPAIVDVLEGVSLAEAVSDGEVSGALKDKVVGSLNLLVLAAKLKGIETDVSQDGDMMTSVQVVLLGNGRQRHRSRSVTSGVLSGLGAMMTTSATGHYRGDQDGEDNFGGDHADWC